MENPTNPLTDSMAQPESEELKPTTTDRLPEAQSLEVADPTPLENESKSAEESKTSVNARLADMTEPGQSSADEIAVATADAQCHHDQLFVGHQF